MSNRYSRWQAAEDIVNADYCWVIEGPWLDAEDYDDTLDEALEHVQSCCEAMIEHRDGDDGDYDGIEWIECRDDVGLLETLLEQMDQDHKWYNDIVELLFMNTLAGA